ncbi:MAG: response regulator [Chloroflexi bacterium]|nr:response regulator [Chloroflexota bacterium]
MVVDDVADFRGYVARILQMLGYDVWQAEDGPSALKVCQENGRSPDLAVLDVSLPGATGPEVAQWLQQCYEGLGVVYMSGYAASYLRAMGILPDGVPFLRKPFGPHDAAQAIAHVLAKRNGDHQEQSSNAESCLATAAD